MVKNKKGGSGHKRLARKNVINRNPSRKLRKASEEGEMYAKVLSISGGGHAKIMCADRKERTLVIRGKFRGRNKRDNTIKPESIVLVALRSVSFGEVVSSNKKEKADLIYVYNQSDKDELKEKNEINSLLDSGTKTEDNEIGFIKFTNDENVKIDLPTENNEESKVEKIGDVEFDWDDI